MAFADNMKLVQSVIDYVVFLCGLVDLLRLITVRDFAFIMFKFKIKYIDTPIDWFIFVNYLSLIYKILSVKAMFLELD